MKEESEKVCLKFNIQKSKIMASNLIASWQIDGETKKKGIDFIFLASKIIADGRLVPWRKVMTDLDSILKSRNITLPKRSI